MRRLARILVIASLAAFVASGFALATSATAMSIEMALADEGAMDMADDQDCDSGAAGHMTGADCHFACNSLLLYHLGEQAALSPPPTASFDLCGPPGFAGRTCPPDPHPPRSSILS